MLSVSNVSITLSVFIRAFFASILELFLWSKGIVVRGFLWTHHNSRIRNDHASRGELSERNVICFGFDYIRVLFTLMNGKLIQNHDATVISFYEFIAGVFYLSLFFIQINLPLICFEL
jgi:hypothetical protein